MLILVAVISWFGFVVLCFHHNVVVIADDYPSKNHKNNIAEKEKISDASIERRRMSGGNGESPSMMVPSSRAKSALEQNSQAITGIVESSSSSSISIENNKPSETTADDFQQQSSTVTNPMKATADTAIGLQPQVQHPADEQNHPAVIVSNNVAIDQSPSSTFGACILIQDDTIRLLEWLAYHYTVLPLGTLYVAIDPKSKRTGTIERILEAWKDRIDVTILKNDTWISLGEEEGWGRPIFVSGNDGPYRPWFKRKQSRSYWSQEHKRRQNFLCHYCQRAMKAKGKSYILITDSDEFLLYNYPKSDENPTRYDALDDFHSKEYWDEKRKWAIPYRQSLPTMEDRVTIMDYLVAHQNEFKDDKKLRPKCIRMPHLQFGAQENDNDNITTSVALPPGVNPSHLLTLRQVHHGIKTGDFSKAILNVQNTPEGWMEFENVLNVHLPNRLMCGRVGGTGSGADYMSHVFRLNHYRAGTLESYVERADDYRGASMERFLEERNVQSVGLDTDIRGWIQWFYDKVGDTKEAKRLLVDPLEEAYAHFAKEAQVLVSEYNVFNRGKGFDENITNPLDLLKWVSEKSSTSTVAKKKAAGNATTNGLVPNNNNQQDDDTITMAKSSQERRKDHSYNKPSMSACLLLNMGDTKWLPEWLAYHYTVLPLQHLIIGVEAKEAKSLPMIQNIVKEWNNTYVKITLQDNEAQWMAGASIDPLTHTFPKTSNLFYSKCMEQMRQQQQKSATSTWTVLVSVQDFVLFNYKHDRHQEREFRHLEGMKVEEIEQMRAKYGPLRDQLPSLSQQVTIAEVLEATTTTSEKEPCIRIPELRFLDQPLSTTIKAVENDKKLKGLHTVMDQTKGDMFGATTKTIVNLGAKKDTNHVHDSFYSLANPSTILCGTDRLNGGTDYIGSLLRYHRYGFTSEKDVPGLSRKINVDIVRWVPWFVDIVGENADKLLFDWLQK